MVIIDKLFNQFGYFKASRASEIWGSGQTTSIFGSPKRFNYDKYLKGYADEAWVYACVYTIANLVAELPYKFVTKKVKDGKIIEESIDVSDARALFERPNKNDANSTWYNLMEVTVAGCELTGNWYWLHDETPEDNPGGKPKSLQYLMSSRVTIIPGKPKHKDDQNVKFIDKYLYQLPNMAKAKSFAPESISHFKYMDPSSYFYGLAPLAPGRLAIETLKEATNTNLNIFKNGAKLDAVLETEQQLSEPVYERTKKEWAQKYQGTKKSHQTGLLEMGLKYKAIQGTMKELEFIKGMKMSREEVCGVFGVPPVLVGILDKANYSNYKESIKIIYKLTIIPKLHKFEPILTSILQLFNPNAYFRYDLSQIEALKQDMKVMSEIAKFYFDMGLPFDEINARLNLGFGKFKGSDVGYLAFNLAPVGSLAAEPVPEEGKSVKKGMSTERKDMLWKQFDRMTKRIIASYEKIIDSFFGKQETAILARLGKSYGNMIEKRNSIILIEPKATKERFSYLIEKEISVDINSVLFNEKEQVAAWVVESKKIHAVALEENGKKELLNLGVGISFDVTNPRVVAWLKKNALEKSTEVVGSLRETLKKEIVAGVEAGEGIQDIKRRINHVYDGYKDEQWKAVRIAQTEVIAASNQGALESYEQSGVVEKKEWLSSRTGDIRDEHLAMEFRKPIPIDSDFVLPSGATCSTPGQTGDAAEDINCKCTVLPVVKKED